MEDYIPVPLTQIKRLVNGDFVTYKKRNDDNWKKGKIKCHWFKEIDGIRIEGLTLVFTNRSKGWTITYDQIEEIQKKINPKFFFEFQYLLNQNSS
jgi:hypothetical protein